MAAPATNWEGVYAVQTARIAELEAKLARLPADWWVDSSLETWFPLSAEMLRAASAEIERLRGEARHLNEEIAEHGMHRIKAEAEVERLRELLKQADTAILWLTAGPSVDYQRGFEFAREYMADRNRMDAIEKARK